MRTTFTLAAFAVCCSTVLASPQSEAEEGLIGLTTNSSCKFDKATAQEIVVMLEKDDNPDAARVLQKVGMVVDDDQKFEFYNNEVFAAIVTQTTPSCIKALESLAEVTMVERETKVQSFAQKGGSPWGLQTISNEAGASGSAKGQEFTYSFSDETLGDGVDIYIIDTGVRTSHAIFGGRAVEGFSFSGSAADGDGHGTHVAGTAGGAKFGVAQNANIIAVRVLGDNGSGSSSDTIAGMDWVIKNHNKRKNDANFIGSIMSMSWGLQGTANAVDKIILGAVEAGIHVSVAAGNDGTDACKTTPAHLGGGNSAVVTVGATNIKNDIASFSNYGECVDIYAPGEQILSSWSTGDNVINFLSGTSMATPHNSGVMATLMKQDPKAFGQNPAALKAKLLATARKDKIGGNLRGSANLLLSNGVDGSVNVKSKRTKAARGVTGSPASWAKSLVDKIDRRWSLLSSEATLRF